MSSAAAVQTSRYYIARNQRSKQFIASATPWSAGLTVTEGAICQSNGLAWEAQNSGVTAGSETPNNSDGATFTDAGGIIWLHVRLLLIAPAAIA